MELLVTLKDVHILGKLAEKGVDGIIFGGIFSMKYAYSLEELKFINDFCKEKGIKRYISIDTFIMESDSQLLDNYLSYLAEENVDGIYFADLGVISHASKFGLEDRLIYDPITLLTNSRDIGFYLNKEIDCVISRELTLKEIVEIVKKYPYRLDMQIFGHLRMSYSKRKFLSNYFNEIEKDIDVNNKSNLTLVEETRNYKLPIKENKYGTSIYTDYILLMYDEFSYLKSLLKRAIIDSEFIPESVLLAFIRDAKRITTDNAEFLKFGFEQRFGELHNFSSGYLYQKTVDKKEDNE